MLNKTISSGNTDSDVSYTVKGIEEDSHSLNSSDVDIFTVKETNGRIELKGVKEGIAKLTLSVKAKNGKTYTDMAYINVYSPFSEAEAVTTKRTLVTRSARTGTDNRNERGYAPKGTAFKVCGQCKGYYRIKWENNTLDDDLDSDFGYISRSDISIPATDVSVSESDITLRKGDSKKLSASVSPKTATDKSVIWKSASTKIATVDQNGTVKGVSKGAAKITATAGEKTATCMVSVYNEIEESTGKVKGYTRAECSILKGAYSSAAVRMAARYEDITIEGDAGSYYYVVADKDSARGFIKIEIPLMDFSISNTELSLLKGMKKQLTIKYIPSITTQRTVKWQSSNNKIASVSKTGQVISKGEGKIKISAEIQCILTAKSLGKNSADGKVVTVKRKKYSNCEVDVERHEWINLGKIKKLNGKADKMQGVAGIGNKVYYFRLKKSKKKIEQFAELYTAKIKSGKLKKEKLIGRIRKNKRHYNSITAITYGKRTEIYHTDNKESAGFIRRITLAKGDSKISKNEKIECVGKYKENENSKDILNIKNRKFHSIARYGSYFILKSSKYHFVCKLNKKRKKLILVNAFTAVDVHQFENNKTSIQGSSCTTFGNSKYYFVCYSYAFKKKANSIHDFYSYLSGISYIYRYSLKN